MPSSASAYFGLGLQSALNTPATTYFKGLSTVSRMAPDRRERQARIVHPAAAARSTRDKAATAFNGFLGGANVTFPLYPYLVGMALIGSGFDVAAEDNTTYFTQSFTIANDSAHKWLSALWYLPTSTPVLNRATNARVSALNINGTVDEIMCDATVRALTQAILTPAPTMTDEEPEEILPWLGSRTITVGNHSLTEAVTGCNLQIINTLNEDKRSLWVSGNTDLPRRNIAVEVALSGIDLSKGLYAASFYGGTAGTSVDTDPILGAVQWEWKSANNIDGAAVPFRFGVTLPSVQFFPDANSVAANADDDIVMNVTARMLDDVATPIVIEMDTDIDSYTS